MIDWLFNHPPVSWVLNWFVGKSADDADRRRQEASNPRPERCPRCDSPQPQLHPALQHEGEVQVCPHPWHDG